MTASDLPMPLLPLGEERNTMRALEPWHLIVLIIVIGVLFGGKRLPDAARGLGRSMRIFKSEIKQMNDDDAPKKTSTEPIEGRIMGGDRRDERPIDRSNATTPSPDRRDV
jgi:sec-independent protein translocase protein TatA